MAVRRRHDGTIPGQNPVQKNSRNPLIQRDYV